jgi:agmatinase
MVEAVVRVGEQIFGRQATWGAAEVYLLGVPWEGCVSFRRGTAAAPQLIHAVSTQLDYYSPDCERLEEAPIYLAHLEVGSMEGQSVDAAYEEKVLNPVRTWVESVLAFGKPFGLIGGDHSVPIGVHQVLSYKRPNYGLLHVDAHADLRPAYEELTYSHATVLYHASQVRGLARMVAVGIRDWDSTEAAYARHLHPRLQVYEMRRLSRMLFQGRPWSEITSEIISLLPEEVYVSIDVDALEVGYVPHTGTPVPGGLGYEQLFFLLETIVRSGRKVIGFDVCETGGAQLDAIVSAHLLYRLCGLALCGSSS